MKHFHDTQAEFMDLCEMPRYTLKQIIEDNLLTNPVFLNQVKLWLRLIREEVVIELMQRLTQLDPPLQPILHDENARTRLVAEIADDIVDSVYVLDGLSNLFGLPREAIFNEVHRANMTKAHKLPSGTYVIKRRADGKILKPDGWQPPQIQSIIEAYTKI